MIEKAEKEALLVAIDLVALIEQETSTRFDEPGRSTVKGCCPWCRGTDRFAVFLYETPQRYFCGINQGAGCGRRGHAIDFLMTYKHMSFGEAVNVLKGRTTGAPVRPERPRGQVTTDLDRFCKEAEDRLWRDEGRSVLQYVQSRGLKEAALREAHAGMALWKGANIARQEARAVPCLVLPWYEKGRVVRVTLRDIRPGIDHTRRYDGMGDQGPDTLYRGDMLADTDKPVFLVEGPLDALSIAQEAFDLITVVATGGTAGGRGPSCRIRLASASHVFVAFDAEAIAERAARGWLRLPNTSRWHTPVGKDANEMLMQGRNLRRWVESALDSIEMYAGPSLESLVCEMCGRDANSSNDLFAYDDFGVMFCPSCWNARAIEPSLTETLPVETQAQEAIQHGVLETIATYTAHLAPGMRVALDLETTGLDRYQQKMVSVQLGIEGDAPCILDMRPFYSADVVVREQWRAGLQQLFASEGVIWIGHNLKFDWLFLAQHFGVKPGVTYDTMIVEQCLHNGREGMKYGMKETAARYGLDVSKEEQKSTVGMDQTQEWNELFRPDLLAYMQQDVIIPHQIYAAQQPLIEQCNLQRVVALENEALRAVIALEHHGALVDRAQLTRLADIKRGKQATLETDILAVLSPAYLAARQREYQAQQYIYEAWEAAQREAEKQWGREYDAGMVAVKWTTYKKERAAAWKAEHPQPAKPKPLEAFKLSSGPHLIEALAELGIEVKDTKEDTLEQVAGKHTIIPVLLQWRKLQTSLTTFGTKLEGHIKSDGRIHTEFRTVSSGRYVTSQPNLQALPKQHAGEGDEEDPRRCIVSPLAVPCSFPTSPISNYAS